jgi:WhiB family redox-sensing transcriptional regulator
MTTATTTDTRRATKPAAQTTTDWLSNGPCRTEDPEIFFPVGDGKEAARKAAEAKAVCQRCPVQERCLQWALESRQDTGVWGGMSEKERRRLHGRKAYRTRPDGLSVLEHIWRDRLPEFHQLAARGLSPKEIAQQMGTNVQTVNSIRARLAHQAQASQGVSA